MACCWRIIIAALGLSSPGLRGTQENVFFSGSGALKVHLLVAQILAVHLYLLILLTHHLISVTVVEFDLWW